MATQPIITVDNDGTGDSFTVNVTADAGLDTYIFYRRYEEDNLPLTQWATPQVGSGSIQITGLPIPGMHEVTAITETAGGDWSLPANPQWVNVVSDDTPVDERILQNLEQVLESITPANGYQTDIQRVRRWRHASNRDEVYPSLTLIVSDETAEDSPNYLYTRSVDVVVDCFIKVANDEDRDEQLSIIKADVETAINADPSRGGIAISTVTEGTVRYIGDDSNAMLRLRVLVVYNTRRNNSYIVR